MGLKKGDGGQFANRPPTPFLFDGVRGVVVAACLAVNQEVWVRFPSDTLSRLAQPAVERSEPLGAACGWQRKCGLHPRGSECAASPSGPLKVGRPSGLA